MSDDPYHILGIAKDATQGKIKKAYRTLAKSLHPDLHPGDKSKQAEFQAVSAAYQLLIDPEQRKRFDAGEIDASGHQHPEQHYYHQYATQDAGRRYDPRAQAGYEDMSDLFSDLFGRRQEGAGEQFRERARGRDLRYHVEVDFLDAARGTNREFTMPDGQRIALTVPAGLKDGQVLRLRGKGGAGLGQGPSGDALVTVSVRHHPVFSRNGDDIEMELPITFDEAVLGARVDVPTISGPVSMAVPKGASSGRRLRLRGRGITNGKGPPGDQVVRLRIVLPGRMDAEMEELAKRWKDQADFDPRIELRRQT